MVIIPATAAASIVAGRRTVAARGPRGSTLTVVEQAFAGRIGPRKRGGG